jgi:hypothetical protein
MKTINLALVLTLAPVGVAAADETATIGDQAHTVIDEAGRFSAEMGKQASRTAALGETALRGMAMTPNQALHMSTDASGLHRLWYLDTGKDLLHAGLVLTLRKPTNESTLFRDLAIYRKAGEPNLVVSIASYNPRGAEGKTWVKKTIATKLPLGFQATKHEVLKRTVESGSYRVETVSRSVDYSFRGTRLFTLKGR